MIWKILKLFLNTLTADDKYSVPNRHNLTQPIQMHLSRKQKTFSELFPQVLKFRLNIEHFQKKITLIANVYRKLPSSKNVVR